MAWPAIFHENLKTSQRLTIAETLCGGNSQFVIQPLVQAIRTVVTKLDETVPAMEAAAVCARRARVGSGEGGKRRRGELLNRDPISAEYFKK